jgi:hypothetical protein
VSLQLIKAGPQVKLATVYLQLLSAAIHLPIICRFCRLYVIENKWENCLRQIRANVGGLTLQAR